MRPIAKKAKKDIHEIWQRQVGEVYPRVFAHRIAGSEDLVRRLDVHAKLEKHKGCVNTVSFNAAGDILVSGSDDRSVVLWDWDAQQVKLSFHSGHSNNVFQAKIMPFADDISIVTCAADGQVRHAQIREGGQVDTIKLSRHRGRAHKLAIEPGSPHIFYTCGEDGVVQHFDLRTHTATKLVTCKSFNGRSTYMPIVALNAIAIDPRNPNLFAIGGSDVYARLYDVRKYKWEGSTDEIQPTDCFCPTHLVGNDDVGITGLAFSDHSELLLSYNDELIYLFPKGTGLGSDPQSSSSKDVCEGSEGPQVYKGHRNADTVKGVNFFGPNCEYVTSGSDCGRIFIWRKKDSQLVRVMEGDKDVVNCVEPHPHATVLATSGIENNIKIWTPKASEPVPLPTTIEEVKSDRRSRWSRFFTPNDLMMHILSRSNAERQHNAGEDDNLEIVEYVMSFTDGDGSSDDGDAENSPGDCVVS
ncbi:uncharacterized protein LOC116247340 isoform X1 [Nymphaea colorata]|nr:uncharacterized protein LOC116247340 isoform X1 [Nymphaea colorata]